MPRPHLPAQLIALVAAALCFLAGATLSGSVALGALAGLTVGAAAAAALRRRATRRRRSRRIDPFALSEPWRRYVSSAQSALRRFDATVRTARRGPLHDRLCELAAQLDRSVDECWRLAKRGDEIDASLARLKVTEARRRLAELEERTGTAPSPEEAATLESLRAQVASAEHLRATATETAARLRMIQASLDRLVATAAEVVDATCDPAVVDSNVNELVGELEALRRAVEEIRMPRTAADP